MEFQRHKIKIHFVREKTYRQQTTTTNPYKSKDKLLAVFLKLLSNSAPIKNHSNHNNHPHHTTKEAVTKCKKGNQKHEAK